jgi:hypothetical protein
MMSTRSIVESATPQPAARPSPAAQIERLDQLILEAETRLEEQEAYVREIALVNGASAVASFELNKMQLLVALLREGRDRLSEAATA